MIAILQTIREMHILEWDLFYYALELKKVGPPGYLSIKYHWFKHCLNQRYYLNLSVSPVPYGVTKQRWVNSHLNNTCPTHFITATPYWKRWRLKSRASRLFAQPFVQAQIKERSKLRVTGLCEGNPPVTGGFPSQRASKAKNVSIGWRHHVWNVRVQKFEYQFILVATASAISVHSMADRENKRRHKSSVGEQHPSSSQPPHHSCLGSRCSII